MSEFETTECSSCGNQIVGSVYRGWPVHQFDLPASDLADDSWETRETYQYTLCTECRRKIVDWIEQADESDVRVDPVGMEQFVGGLEMQAQELESLADDLQALMEDSDA